METVPISLIQKYNVSGPRYTSYPPVPHFKSDVDLEWAAQSFEEANVDSEDAISLYFHLPFCQSLCWFCGCTKIITTDSKLADRYLEYLEKEIELRKPASGGFRRVIQIHFGGGSPTFLTPEQILKLGEILRKYFDFHDHMEMSVEVDPRSLTEAKADALCRIGCNRVSLGVQDLDPVVQKSIHRVQPIEMTEQAIDWFRQRGIHSINFDLIYGLPHQTESSFEKTLERIVEFFPDRIALYSYAHIPRIRPSQKIFEKQDSLPDAETKLAIFQNSVRTLVNAGYVYLGMDHFARNGDELEIAQREKKLRRNFQGYSTHSGTDIYAFGMSSISFVGGVYAQNVKTIEAYYAALDRNEFPLDKVYSLTADDCIRSDAIMSLMCDFELDFKAIGKCWDIVFVDYFQDVLSSLYDLEEDGLLIVDAEKITVTERGRFFIRNIAMRFDAYIEKAVGYSKTV